MPTSTGQLRRICFMLACSLPLLGSAANSRAQDKPCLVQPAQNQIPQNQPALGKPAQGKSAQSKSAQGQPAQGQQPEQQPGQITENLTPVQTMSLGEIAWLRSRIGGGATESLKGFIPGTDPDQQVHEMIAKLVREQGSRVEQLPPPTDSMSTQATGVTGAAAGARSGLIFGDLNSGSQLANIDPEQRILRATAKQLEELAAKLEQAKFYDQADELRKTAAKYWVQARTMD